MRAKRFGGIAAAAALSVSFLILTGCQPVENLVVPPRAAMLGQLHPNQTYVLQRTTTMEPIDTGNAQPEIHLAYDKNSIVPAEAFERVPFPVDATVTIHSSDPSATATATAYYVPVGIPAGSEMIVSTAEIYTNSHVYRARVRSGPERNCYILLVVPSASNATLPTISELQSRDKDYLVPLTVPSAQPATLPATEAVR
jgi:hypothetical protein